MNHLPLISRSDASLISDTDLIELAEAFTKGVANGDVLALRRAFARGMHKAQKVKRKAQQRLFITDPIPLGEFEIETAKMPTMLLQEPWAVIDVEMSGLPDEPEAEMLELSVIKLADGHIRCLTTLIKNQHPISAHSSAVHGIDNATAAQAPGLSDVVDVIRGFIGTATIFSHEAGTDAFFVEPVLGGRADFDALPHRWICTHRLARKILPNPPSYALSVLRYALNLTPYDVGLGVHRAASDAFTALELLKLLVSLAEEDGARSFDDLRAIVNEQKEIAAHQEVTFGKHAGKRYCDLPSHYLKWVRETHRGYKTDPALRAAVDAVLASRDRVASDPERPHAPKSAGIPVESGIRIDFGRYEGELISAVPLKTLQAYIQHGRGTDSMREHISTEVARRTVKQNDQ